jgi:putative ABC transport system ATP-binding protein
VFQSFHHLPRLTAWENVALPLLYGGTPRGQRKPRALAMLEQVGLAHHAERRPNELSGGEQQRVAVARALIGGPRLILADEPTGSLDSVTAGEVMALLRDLNRRLAVTVLMVTHDRELAQGCDRRIELLDGRVIADSAHP